MVGNYGIPKDYHLQVLGLGLVDCTPATLLYIPNSHATKQTMRCCVGLGYHHHHLPCPQVDAHLLITPPPHYPIDITVACTAHQAALRRPEDASRLLRDLPAEPPPAALRRAHQRCGHGDDRLHGGGK